jgi:NADH:ubiquinone oxidoreductase subunit D
MSELEILQKKLEIEGDLYQSIYCTIEEMSEATKVLTKFLRKSHKFSIEDLTEEIAHSLLMLDIIKNVFKLSDENINNQKLLALQKYFNKQK